MAMIPDDLELEYVKAWRPGEDGMVPATTSRVKFASREIFTEQVWDPIKGIKDQQFVRVSNPDIWGGKIRYPFESEFKEVK